MKNSSFNTKSTFLSQRVFYAIGIILIAAFSVIFLASCSSNPLGNNNSEADGEKTVTIVIGEENQVVLTETTNSGTLSELLNELSEKGKLTYTAESGAYGEFLTAVGQLDSNATENSDYIAILTSDTDPRISDSEYNEYAVVRTYNGKKMVSTIVGASELPLRDGEIYMFVLVGF